VKHGRVIPIKDPLLRQFRYNLRRLFKEAIQFKNNSYQIKKQEILKKSGNNPSDSDTIEIQKLNKEQSKLRMLLKYSICKCGMCSADDVDMVWHAGWGEWWCLKCFREEEEAIDPKNKFNKGVIVHENAEKPCHILHWCPYGNLAESFRLRNLYSRYTCLVFDHDCPSFYVSEHLTEFSRKEPIKSERSVDNLRDCEGFNDQKIRVYRLKKPCHILDWCPYGSLGDEFFIRELDYKYGCKIYPHDCPSFYHAESLRERVK
jgi:hypothetical protein